MQKPFDFGATWSEAVALVTGNVQILIAVIGVFFVIPQFAMTMVMGDPLAGASGDPNAVLDEMLTFYADNFLPILIASLIGVIGTVTVLTIYLDESRPTVGTAIAAAFGLFIPYFLTSLLMGLAIGIGFMLLIVPGIYLAIKFICAAPIIVAEKERNPIAALQRSWELTKGNSLRIFGFIVVLFVVLFVISLIVGIVAGIFMIAGSIGASIGQLVQVLFQGVATAFSLAISAAIYRQLSGPGAGELKDTFG
ncbi:glycerophosphoryl diester phosphodiesterase membrane domain-containing protein [Alterisphingorhabdus coralli]|uniref:Glycerophosphoryl diester phosphodiesterase membrane domain-containing protein n=1 Tax=Alterisphingorhabdus coralli TaxID=3071408 RepID=A0AA97F9T5_9SPHN|nr:glycerophosphoryl diester phosphodiesterase membrane domain-containing protein [Parasphingorhabdus sp. SCSIO 66989]WOE75130.1 glycerophosphoryl diester phosphodiesterase membrane domain-containing protein [Parasphingorhabdus sp. SCSIO 66989]